MSTAATIIALSAAIAELPELNDAVSSLAVFVNTTPAANSANASGATTGRYRAGIIIATTVTSAADIQAIDNPRQIAPAEKFAVPSRTTVMENAPGSAPS